ncbi:18795_t:CDS:2 [Gigaspora rosea]|nr:18795_t:CDS:2 [Gigaspora rosea]
MRFGQELFGESGKMLMSLLVAISTFGCVGALIFTYTRIIKYAAETGFMPRRISSWLNSYSINWDTLKYSISGNISDFFANTSQYSAMIYHGASAYCLYVLKKKLKNTNPEIFSIPKFMVKIYFIIIILIVIALFIPPGNGNLDYLIPCGISWSAVILGVILWWFRDRNRSEGSNCEKNRTEESEESIGETDQNEETIGETNRD